MEKEHQWKGFWVQGRRRRLKNVSMMANSNWCEKQINKLTKWHNNAKNTGKIQKTSFLNFLAFLHCCKHLVHCLFLHHLELENRSCDQKKTDNRSHGWPTFCSRNLFSPIFWPNNFFSYIFFNNLACSRFSLFVHLKLFLTQFKNVHLRGPCSLRPSLWEKIYQKH